MEDDLYTMFSFWVLLLWLFVAMQVASKVFL